MKLSGLGPSITFAAVLTFALGIWPAACARTTPGRGAAAASGSAMSGPTVPAAFLPAPAFAQTVDASGKPVSLADIASRDLPSVVNVASTRIQHADPRMSPFLNDPFFHQFFGPGFQAPKDQLEHGLGSGVIISKDGIVLTNNHVVDGASELKVYTQDKREYSVKVLGTDPKSDLAVLRLQGDVSGLKPITIGDSSRLRLGDVVLAIGNPFGVGETVTMGIVSAKGRANVGIADYEDFIQTDAAINPGNSGGALVDMEGNLVGINTAILSRSGGYQGIGFAIPTNMAKPIMDSLMKTGHVVRGWLGVSIQDIDQDLAQALGLPSTQGVLVSGVEPGSPAAKAGMQRGDVVLAIDGTKVGSTGALRNAVAEAGAHVKVKVDILRAGKPQTIDVELGEMPADTAKQGGGSSTPGAASSALDGVTLQSLDAQSRRQFKIPPSVKEGVVVTQVDPSSTAAEEGLRPGDVVMEVNRQKVDSIEKFKQLYSAHKGKVLLLVNRHGTTLFLVVSH